MAIRMQQRRGSASQWTAANPVLASGEIGFETDTGEFKIGDGVTAWTSLNYFKDILDLGDDYVKQVQKAVANGVASLDSTGNIPLSQLGNEVSARNSAISSAVSSAISTEVSDRNSAIGSSVTAEANARDLAISNAVTQASNTLTTNYTDADNVKYNTVTNDIATAKSSAIATAATDATTKANTAKTDAETFASGAVSTHNSSTTNVHGISDTSVLVTSTQLALKAPLSGPTFTGTVTLPSTTSIGNVSSTEIGYVDGVTSAIQTQLDAKLASATAATTYAPLASPTFTGTINAAALTLSGNLVVNGTTTTVSSANLELTDSLIYLSSQQYTTDVVDIGIYGAYGTSGNNSGNHPHTGLVRDASDGKWKLISAGSEPVSNVVDFTSATYDTLKLGGLEFSDGTQVKQGVPSLTTINQQAASYTPVLTDRDKLIEVSSASGVTVTIPTNASVAYPVGTSFDILQTGAGQITIAGAGGVTVNATPGLKLRTQWSSATIFKRATDTWVVYGDLTA